MKTKNMIRAVAPLIVSLTVVLWRAVPAYAITSTAVANEDPDNQISDTLVEGANPDRAYAGSVVDGILAPAPEEPVVATQETPPPAPAKVYVKPAPAAPEAPAPTEEVEQVADDSSISLNNVESQQVLGVSTERDKLTAYYGDLRKSMDTMTETHNSMNNFLLTAMLVLAAVIPLQVFILVIQFRMEESLLTRKRQKKKR